MYLPQHPLVPKNPNGPLQTIVLGRVSTPYQPLSNIDAGQEYAESILKTTYRYSGPIEFKRLGEQGSGMLTERASINEANALIATGLWDVVLMEDLSKPYRNPRWQYAFVQDTVDARTRLISVGDNLDTGEDNWEVALAIAIVRHGLYIPDVRRRVRRTATHTFHAGGMVIKVKFGYRKLSKEEAASGLYGPLGLRIAKIPEHTPTIREIRDRILADEEYSSIASWLHESGVSPGPYVLGNWKNTHVIDLMRDDILCGHRKFRNTLHEPIFRSGEHRKSKNDNPEREYYPELAHLTIDEHAQLVQHMDRRAAGNRKNSGPDSPRYNVPRSASHWPAQHPRCMYCNAILHLYDLDFLKCPNAYRNREVDCWMHVQTRVNHLRDRVLAWMFNYCGQIPGVRDAMATAAWNELESKRSNGNRLQSAQHERLKDLKKQANRLAKAIRMSDNIEAIVNQSEAVQNELNTLRRQMEQQSTVTDVCNRFMTRDDVENQLETAVKELALTSFSFAALMRRIFPQMTIHPVQALDCPQVRPRVKFTFSPAALFGRGSADPADHVGDVCAALDLFDPPKYIECMPICVRERRENPKLSLKKIEAKHGINYMTVKRALAYARLMEKAGTSVPYVELKEKPANASRWKRRA